MMSNAIEQSVAKVPSAETGGEETPHVQVIDGALCSTSELRRAVVAGAILSGFVCTIAGVGIGYLLGLRDGREGR